MTLIQLIYVSAARPEMDPLALANILQKSHSNNLRQSVTGMLLYSGGNFMQVLEGAEHDVDTTYSRILDDARHGGLIVIERSPIEGRNFSRWSMGYRKLVTSDAEANAAYAPYFVEGFDASQIRARPGLSLELLKLFANMQRN